MDETYDVVVVGGGAAGLNGALMLARSRRSVLVIDSRLPRNAPADGVRGLLGHDGVPPADLLATGRGEVRRYGGEVVKAEVTGAERHEEREHAFTVALADGRTVAARRLLVTTGLVDELPDVAGLRERWGKDVVHCPYCHGWEVRDEPIGVLASSPLAMHQVLLFRQLTHDVVLFTNGVDFDADQREQLLALAVGVVDGEVREIEVRDDRIVAVRLVDGRVVPRTVVATATRMVARAEVLTGIGLTTVPYASGMGEHVVVDATGRTDVPGVWAAGNVTDLSAQVGGAAAAGAMAGAQINLDLVMEDARQAVEDYRTSPVGV